MAEIRLVNLQKEFKDIVAVQDVTMTFPTSTVTGLLGPSGCGKTTMMRMIAGLETPSAGDVYFDNDCVTDLPPRKRNIGMVFQYPVVYKGISVYRNIELPLIEEKHLSRAERKKRVDDVVEILGLQDSINKDTSQLDMGTRQKVAVARAVARQPRIILFDEPITNVDIETKVQLKQALKRLSKQHNQTIIYVTHDQTEAMTLADQIALMKDGAIVQKDEPRKLYNYPNTVFGGWFLGNPGMNFFEHNVKAENSSLRLVSPLFPSPLRMSEVQGETGAIYKVTLGIRPEKIRVLYKQTPRTVQGQIVRKFVAVGGQYMLTVKVGKDILKVKVDPDFKGQVHDDVWLESPLDWTMVFGPEGHRLDAKLSF